MRRLLSRVDGMLALFYPARTRGCPTAAYMADYPLPGRRQLCDPACRVARCSRRPWPLPLPLPSSSVPPQSVRTSRANHALRFLLKYASRDEVDLLGRGNGGVAEMRNAIAEYEETSPLYGFLRYRRRNVLIKYLPEDCSRLIQGEWHSHDLRT